jgi:hypothetical protein
MQEGYKVSKLVESTRAQEEKALSLNINPWWAAYAAASGADMLHVPFDPSFSPPA